jgi:hypothetical protein
MEEVEVFWCEYHKAVDDSCPGSYSIGTIYVYEEREEDPMTVKPYSCSKGHTLSLDNISSFAWHVNGRKHCLTCRRIAYNRKKNERM